MDHEGPQNKIIQIDGALAKRELAEVVRASPWIQVHRQDRYDRKLGVERTVAGAN
jgi:hypothetical protein